MKYDFRWVDWNVEHVAKHGVSPAEAEYVVEHPSRGYPARHGGGKTIARGQTAAGRYLQVIYLIEEEGTLFVIHARDLEPGEKKNLKRRRRR